MSLGEVGFAHEVASTAPVRVDGRDAVELLYSEWSRDRNGERTAIHRFTSVLDHDRARWLTVTLDVDGEARTPTKGDPEFDAGWAGTGPRRWWTAAAINSLRMAHIASPVPPTWAPVSSESGLVPVSSPACG